MFFFLLLPFSCSVLLFFLLLLLLNCSLFLQLSNLLANLLLFFGLGLQVPLDLIDHFFCFSKDISVPRSRRLLYLTQISLNILQSNSEGIAISLLPPLAMVELQNGESEDLHYSLDLVLVQGTFPVYNVYNLLFNKSYS